MTRQEIPVFKTREENVAYMNATLPIRESFDLIQRDLLIGGRVSSFYYVNGFTSEETMLKIMDALLKVKEEDIPGMYCDRLQDISGKKCRRAG